ncbi:MAG TPA: hypothetical protein VEU62_04465 [Bryobacterales bacterium]|nr:hypothetical protein [Bryobacterales bacterium]
MIRVPVWVESRENDSDTAPLAAKNIRATLDGHSAPIVVVRGPGDDLMLLIVLDLTGDLSLVEPAKKALQEEIGKLPPNAFAGLLRAQDGPRVLADPTPDRHALAEQIENLPVSGKAGLLDTVDVTEGIADSILIKSTVRVAVLYVTDSDIRNYREDFINPVINSSDTHDLSRRFPDALIQEKISKLSAGLSSRQTPLFIVHLQYSSEQLNEAYQNGLKQLAEVTGGSSSFCQSTAEIPAAIQRIFALILSQYSVTLALPERAGKSVQVELQAGDNRPLNYRTRFVLKGR